MTLDRYFKVYAHGGSKFQPVSDGREITCGYMPMYVRRAILYASPRVAILVMHCA